MAAWLECLLLDGDAFAFRVLAAVFLAFGLVFGAGFNFALAFAIRFFFFAFGLRLAIFRRLLDFSGEFN
jgi:hypothetical protein